MRNLITVAPGRCLTGVQRLGVKACKACNNLSSKTLDPRSQNAFEMVRALWSILIVFLTENCALPISKRIRNGSSTMDYLKIFLTENCALPIGTLGDDGDLDSHDRLTTV